MKLGDPKYNRHVCLIAAPITAAIIGILRLVFHNAINTCFGTADSVVPIFDSAPVSEENGYAVSEASSIEPQTTEPEVVNETSPTLESIGKFSLTAYCPCVECCDIWSADHPSRIGTDYIQKTASGTIPKAGRTIGVDPDIIPFGTTVIINGHEYVAEDCGGGVNGNSIDIFFDDHNEALEFGRKTAEVYIKN